MRSPSEIRERIVLLLIEEINKVGFDRLSKEPENTLPAFVEGLSNKLSELVLDEIMFARRY